MSREPVVTRTVITQTALIRIANDETNSIEELEIVIPKCSTSKQEALIKKRLTSGEHFINIVSVEENTNQYSMPLSKFVELADVSPCFKGEEV